MPKTLAILAAILIGGCTSSGGLNQNAIARELISSQIDQQCHSQLNARQEWQLASALMGAENKQQWENKICGCVSEEAPAQMTTEDMLQVLNPASRDKVISQIAVKTVKACIRRVLQ
jgi:lipoprotein